MLFSNSILAAAALVGAAFAADHKVIVSTKTGDLLYNPNNLTAAEGDTVTFHFWPKNHSVVQASFDKPCQPMANGFYSGFVPTSDTSALASTTFTYTVKNASAPIWFYCSQGKHCQNGMVGVINPPKSGAKTLEAFMNASMAATDNVSPDTVAGTGGMLSKNGTSSTNSTSATGAGSHLTGSAMFAGMTGLFTYLLI